VAERELNLIELGAALVGQLRVRPPQVVRGDVRVLLDAAPDALTRKALASDLAALVDAPEQ